MTHFSHKPARISPSIALLALALLAPAHLAAQTGAASGGTTASSGTPAPSGKNTQPAKTTRGKKATVKTGAATVVSGDYSAPKLVSTTGGDGGAETINAKSTAAWRNFAELQKAADEKNPDACYALGQRYLRGSRDTPKNITRARLYLEDAAQLGHTDANFRLGKIYADGTEVPQDLAKAFAYYTTAARAGMPEAQHNLGAMYASGRGVKRDYAEGLAWLIIAARGTPEARASEAKLRKHLEDSKRMETIIAAEDRAKKLTQELASVAYIEQPATRSMMDETKPKPLNVPITPMPVPIAPMPKPEPVPVHSW